VLSQIHDPSEKKKSKKKKSRLLVPKKLFLGKEKISLCLSSLILFRTPEEDHERSLAHATQNKTEREKKKKKERARFLFFFCSKRTFYIHTFIKNKMFAIQQHVFSNGIASRSTRKSLSAKNYSVVVFLAKKNNEKIINNRRHGKKKNNNNNDAIVVRAASSSDVSSKHLPGKIILQGENNLEVTPAIRAYVEEKLAKAVANADPRDVREIDCRVASRGGADHATKGAHVCTTKATVLTRAGQIEVVEEHEDLYASIDKVADGLKRQLRKYSEKREGNARGKKEEILAAAGSEDEDDDEVPPAA
jgi:ribosomal subunit interface protein